MTVRFITPNEQAALLAAIKLAEALEKRGDDLGIHAPSEEPFRLLQALAGRLRRGRLILMSLEPEDLKAVEATLTQYGQNNEN